MVLLSSKEGRLTSLRLHMRRFGVALGTIRPGTNTKETRKIMTPGATKLHKMRVEVEIFSLMT